MAALRQLRNKPRRFAVLAVAALLAALVSLIGPHFAAHATTGGSPYDVPTVASAGGVLETILTADEKTVDIGNGVTANALTYNGTIPGPTFLLDVNDVVIVRFVNDLASPSAIHWHGIELENSADGTPFTQNEVCGGCTFLYKFKVPRPGIYWYHPHHHSSTNQVFKGLYGMIIVRDPNEAALQTSGVLPPASATRPIVLSDMTVCKPVGTNDALTYPLTLPWVGGGTLPQQPGPTPRDLCETSPIDEHGDPRSAFAAGDIPNNQTKAHFGRVNEGQTVLTNGVNVGGRVGTPASPGALAGTAQSLNVQSGQGLRLELLNAAATRYFRLRLTTSTGTLVPLLRVGGEGGLLDNAVREGGTVGTFNTKFDAGQILLPPGTRADVVAAIPTSASGVLTLWTEDFSRTGPLFANLPTVPVMHLNVTGAAPSTYTIANNAPVLASVGATVPTLPAPGGATLLNPATFVPAKTGASAQNVQLTAAPNNSLGVDNVIGPHDIPPPFTAFGHLTTTRYAKVGDTLELTVQNATSAHHPFHLHGFSMQPLDLTRTGFPTFTWSYKEFRDNIDIPAQYTLRFRIRIDDRPLADATTPGGALGRWLFHCHIFFHATNGMLGEVVVVAPNGNEKPEVNVGGSWEFAATGDIAERHGTFADRDGDPVTLTAHLANGTPIGTVVDTGGGKWSWTHDTTGEPDSVRYVYVTATDTGGRKDEAVFRLKVGGIDDGADNGDPHLTTVDGTRYDFQSAGEFTLLRSETGLELQARQTPVTTQTPITDSYSGLTSCVSVNTAVATRFGSHRITYQPGSRENPAPQLVVDGEQTRVTTRGLELGPDARVVAYALPTGTAIEFDYPDGTVVTAAPWYWSAYDIWLLNVDVFHTPADEGVLGNIAKNSWLPALPNGTSVGPKPAGLHARYVALYQTFADAWRVTDATSLFTYASGTSTATFSPAWPPETPPCKAPRRFQGPQANPTGVTIRPAVARRFCLRIRIPALHANCVFDVASTGDPEIAKSYLLTQDLQLRGTTTRVRGDRDVTAPGEGVTFTATVAPMGAGRPLPAGRVKFVVDGASGPTVKLGRSGRAAWTVQRLGVGDHRVTATYTPVGEENAYLASNSLSVLHTVTKSEKAPPLVSAGLAGPGGRPGWFTGPVTVTLTGTAPIRFSIDGGPAASYSKPFTVTAAGRHVVAFAPATGDVRQQSIPLQIDATPPKVAIAAPTAGAEFPLRAKVRANYRCSDSGSRLEHCVGTVRNGALIDTRKPGTATFSVTAADKAGNRRTVTATYTVTPRG